MRHIITISGKDSLCAALVQTAYAPDLPYEYVFCDVGTELPETYAWLSKVEAATGWKIQRMGRNLEEMIARWNFLPSQANRFCTKHGKIKPLETFQGKQPTTIYYGVRADESRDIRPLPTSTARFPLVELGIDLRGVWTILAAKNLLPPSFFWPSLYYRVCEYLDGTPDWLEPWEEQMLFAGRSRANCYFCFFQRQYEYLWLHETHPDLFWRACGIERFTGTSLTSFKWQQRYYLDELLSRRHEILDRRARQLTTRLAKRLQGGFFIGQEETELSATSCGLFCGK